jgi:hypothetical protein
VRFKSSGLFSVQGAKAMRNTPAPRQSRPAPWAVALLALSSGFAALSIALISTGYSPI